MLRESIPLTKNRLRVPCAQRPRCTARVFLSKIQNPCSISLRIRASDKCLCIFILQCQRMLTFYLNPQNWTLLTHKIFKDPGSIVSVTWLFRSTQYTLHNKLFFAPGLIAHYLRSIHTAGFCSTGLMFSDKLEQWKAASVAFFFFCQQQLAS